VKKISSKTPAFLFDLDGTLIDSLYQHVLAWREALRPSLDALEVPSSVPIITRDQVEQAKPDPDLFLAAAAKLRVDIANFIVVGDSVWDLLAARRARALGVGVLSGGYGQDELERAGAYRVYQDPYDLLKHLDELGVRTPA
jgi:phosphoglycolate phosphatase-like HAD superfamily hydrolase